MEKLVYCALISYQGSNETCWPAQQTLANILGISKPTVYRTIKNLEKLGWVGVKVFGHGKTNRYRCLMTNLSQRDYNSQAEGACSQPDVQTLVTVMSNLSQPDVQPTSERLSLVVEEDKTNQPTNLLEGVGREVGWLTSQKEIERLTHYKVTKADEASLRYIDSKFSKEQIKPILMEVIDDWDLKLNTDRGIDSIPRVVAYRLRQAYGKS